MEANQTIPLSKSISTLGGIRNAADAPTAPRETNLWRDAWRRLLRNKLATLGLIIVIIFLLLAIFADLLTPYAYDHTDFSSAYQFPNARFPLGTDALGRDMLSRLIYGARISMVVGIGSQLLVLLIGVPLGAIAGYYGGKVDLTLMRFVDVMYAFPTLLFVILVMTALGAGLLNIFIALGLTSWVTICRLIRGQLLALREKEFVEGARAVGVPQWRILLQYLIPNALGPIIVAVTFGFAGAIVAEAALSFLGVGVQPPQPSWGTMIRDNALSWRYRPWLVAVPGFTIGLISLGINFLGDGLNDALNPKQAEQ